MCPGRLFTSFLLIRQEVRVIFKTCNQLLRSLHVLFAVEVPAEQVRVITAYRPDPEAWESDQKT